MKVPVFPPARDYQEAVAIQREMAGRVRLCRLTSPPRLIAGTDVAFESRSGLAIAAVVVVDGTTLKAVARVTRVCPVCFPYIPGLLSFRELPALLECFAELDLEPDAVICDGQGIAHPRGLGLAAHLGLLLQIPVVGCAKSRLVGEFAEPGASRGCQTPLAYQGRQVGSVLRTRTGVKPVFVSPGHLVSFDDAVRLVLAATTRYRLPEPTRLAHQAAGQAKPGLPAAPAMRSKLQWEERKQ